MGWLYSEPFFLLHSRPILVDYHNWSIIIYHFPCCMFCPWTNIWHSYNSCKKKIIDKIFFFIFYWLEYVKYMVTWFNNHQFSYFAIYQPFSPSSFLSPSPHPPTHIYTHWRAKPGPWVCLAHIATFPANCSGRAQFWISNSAADSHRTHMFPILFPKFCLLKSLVCLCPSSSNYYSQVFISWTRLWCYSIKQGCKTLPFKEENANK